MAKSFVFYESFLDSILSAPESMQLELFMTLTECGLGLREETDVPYPASIFITQAMATVAAARDRYEKAKSNGEKGGRPKKNIDSDLAETLHSELGSWDRTSDELGIDRKTLYKYRMAAKAHTGLGEKP